MATETEVKTQDSVPSNPEWVAKGNKDLELRAEIRKEYEQLFKLWKESELQELEKTNDKTIQEGLQKLFDKWVEEQKPPTNEEIQLLLNQEYETFFLKVHFLDDAGEEKSEMFTLRELPQSVEIAFYKQFTDRVMNKVQSLAAFAQTDIERPFEERAKSFLTLFGEGFDLLADAVVLVLNPFGKRKDITRDWIQQHVSSNRQWNIIEAQMKVNRLKDFFSKVSQSGQQTQTMMGNVPRFQQLQQLAR